MKLHLSKPELIKELDERKAECRVGLFKCPKCGNEFKAIIHRVNSGDIKSCGCGKGFQPTHGLTNTEIYNIWHGIKNRCLNPKSKDYHKYGQRGINICDEWKNDVTKFMQDMGPRPGPEYSVHRIDNEGNYEPGNCKWATTQEQARERRTNRKITYQGQTKTIIEWCEITGIKHSTLCARLDKGLSPEIALTTPVVQCEKLFTYNGKTQNIDNWAKELNIGRNRLYRRIQKGMTIEEAINSVYNSQTH